MNSMVPYLNLRSLSSTEARIARTHGFQNRMIGAVAVCAAVLAMTPAAFAMNDNANAASSDNGMKMAPTISLEEAVAKHQTVKYVALVPVGEAENAPVVSESEAQNAAGLPLSAYPYVALTPEESVDAAGKPVGETSYYGVWTTYPYVHRFLVSFVAYNDYCQEITPGYWTEGSIGPSFGLVTQAHVKGRLSNGDCSQYVYTGAGIFYQWVYNTNYYQNDEFKANWHGGGLENKVTFYLKDR